MVRMLARFLGVLGALAAALVALVMFLSQRQIDRRWPTPPSRVVAATDSASLARGAHLYRSITCALCHGEDGGGAIYGDQKPMLRLTGSNLTTGRGGVAPYRTDHDLVLAIRHGVKPNGRSLLVMPSEVFAHLSDPDLAAILGYLRNLPPVDRELPPSRFYWMGRALLAAGKLDLLVAGKTPADAARDPAPPDATAGYGRYLADISGCHGCHGFGLSGGAVAGPPGLPPASNLTPTGLGTWTEADFFRAMRQGLRPAGTTLDEFMPWKSYRDMTDEDLRALWLYLQSVPPREFGGK